ncbi:MAG: hypothetical protein AAF513_10125 [Pseudomonadota bacterium]
MDYLVFLAYAVAAYIGLLLVLELVIWRAQPTMDGGITLRVTDAAGASIQRNLYGHNYEGQLYVASNHWFRGWYRDALERPTVEAARHGEDFQRFRAVPVVGEEHAQVMADYSKGFMLRLACGFAPSKLLRLEPDP